MKIDSLNSPTDGNSVFGAINHIANLSSAGSDNLKQNAKQVPGLVNQKGALLNTPSVRVTKVTQQALNYYATIDAECQNCKL